jgi:hypothetical protein
MSKIRYGTSSKKGLIRSKAFPRTNIINLKRLIVATGPSGPFVPFAPGTLWYGPSSAANTMFRGRDFAGLAEDTATHWGFVIQENGLDSTNFMWQNSSQIQNIRRIKLNTPNTQNNYENALAGVEFEITGVMPADMWGKQVNIGFKVPKSFLPVLPAEQNSWEIPGEDSGTFSLYTP